MITKEEIIRHWQIQENLLQSYRSLFVISQTLLIGTGAIIAVTAAARETVFIFIATWILALFMITYWQRITKARALDVSFLQGMLYNFEQFEAKENLMREFKQWQKLDRTNKLKQIESLSIEPSQTRQIMEGRLPMMYLLLWMVLASVILYKSFV